MVLGFDALVMIIGLLIYVLAKDGKICEVGRIMFAFGLLALLLSGEQIVAVLRGGPIGR